MLSQQWFPFSYTWHYHIFHEGILLSRYCLGYVVECGCDRIAFPGYTGCHSLESSQIATSPSFAADIPPMFMDIANNPDRDRGLLFCMLRAAKRSAGTITDVFGMTVGLYKLLGP